MSSFEVNGVREGSTLSVKYWTLKGQQMEAHHDMLGELKSKHVVEERQGQR